MKCPSCGTNLQKGVTTCPMCRNYVEENEVDVPYIGKTKSKTLAGILMLFGIGDLYLLRPKRFIQKLVYALPTLCMLTLWWQIKDTYDIFTGKINCDANGTPLV